MGSTAGQPTETASVVGTTAFDIAKIRADFRALEQKVHGRSLVYLDSAASAHKPRQVLESVMGFCQRDFSNIHRGSHTLSMKATEAYEAARTKVAKFIGASNVNEVVFVRGCTEAINLVAMSFGADLEPGDEVLVSELEHHSNLLPWQMACQRSGATLRPIPIDDNGDVSQDDYVACLSDKTKIVAIAHVSNALGTVLPVRRMIREAHRVGAKVLVDGAQGVVHMPVDVEALGCDFYVFSGHKLYGPTGIGVLWGKYPLLEAMPPYQVGGGTVNKVSFTETTYVDPPQRFEAGTPNIAGAIGLGAAVDYLSEIGMERVQAYESELLSYAEHELSKVPGLKIIGGGAKHRASVISFVIDGVHPDDIGTIIDHEGVAIRVGQHCAQPALARFGLTATARASLGLYNNHDDIDRLVSALLKARELLA